MEEINYFGSGVVEVDYRTELLQLRLESVGEARRIISNSCWKRSFPYEDRPVNELIIR